jgi:hypothetical protein
LILEGALELRDDALRLAGEDASFLTMFRLGRSAGAVTLRSLSC